MNQTNEAMIDYRREILDRVRKPMVRDPLAVLSDFLHNYMCEHPERWTELLRVLDANNEGERHTFIRWPPGAEEAESS